MGSGISKMQRDRRLTGLLFLLPSVVLVLIFVAVPFVRVCVYSFTNYRGLPGEYKFVGLENYKFLLNMQNTWTMIGATFFYVICDTILKNVLSFILALSLDKKGRGRLNRSLMRTVWYLPALFSGASLGVAWHIMYIYKGGVINTIIKTLGGTPVNWLETKGVINIAIVIAAVWCGIGACSIIYLAGLQGISTDLYEAAYLDGASEGQITRFITFPLMAPALTINLVTSMIGAFKAYELPKTIGEGPGECAKLIASEIYEYGFAKGRYAAACALSVILILFIVALSLVQLRILQRNEEKNG